MNKSVIILLLAIALISTGCEVLKDGDTVSIVNENELTTIEGYIYSYYPSSPLQDVQIEETYTHTNCETSGDGYFLFAIDKNERHITLSIRSPYDESIEFFSIEKNEGVAHYGPFYIYLNNPSHSPLITNVNANQDFEESSTYNLEWEDVAYGGYEIRIDDAAGYDFPPMVYEHVYSPPPFNIEIPSVNSSQGAHIRVKSIETGQTNRVNINISDN